MAKREAIFFFSEHDGAGVRAQVCVCAYVRSLAVAGMGRLYSAAWCFPAAELNFPSADISFRRSLVVRPDQEELANSSWSEERRSKSRKEARSETEGRIQPNKPQNAYSDTETTEKRKHAAAFEMK